MEMYPDEKRRRMFLKSLFRFIPQCILRADRSPMSKKIRWIVIYLLVFNFQNSQGRAPKSL